jgi:hypothetical protein
MAAWGWSLSGDIEGTRHWRLRRRGVGTDSERGYRFRGRTAALESIRDWLDRDRPDRRVLMVTGGRFSWPACDQQSETSPAAP